MISSKRFSHFYKIIVNIFLLIILLFIVISSTESGDNSEQISVSVTPKVSSNGRIHQRVPRSVRRGQNVYYQRGFEVNRLRHELENSLRAPRHKPFFHNVNEVYSYYLPQKYNKINANVENFSDKYDDHSESYGAKTRSMTRARGEQRVSLTRRVLPTDGYQDLGYQVVRDEKRLIPVIPVRAVPPIRSSQYSGSQRDDQQRYRPPYQRYTPRVVVVGGREPPSVSSGEDITYARRTTSSLSSISGASPLIPEPQSLVRNSTYAGIPGWQPRDFPGYSTIPYTGFRCTSQPYYGYYADVTAGCQVFHVCQPDGREYSFLCPNGTLYHQKVQTCDWWWHVDCPSSPRFYYLNARIGVIPPIDSTLYRFPKTS